MKRFAAVTILTVVAAVVASASLMSQVRKDPFDATTRKDATRPSVPTATPTDKPNEDGQAPYGAPLFRNISINHQQAEKGSNVHSVRVHCQNLYAELKRLPDPTEKEKNLLRAIERYAAEDRLSKVIGELEAVVKDMPDSDEGKRAAKAIEVLQGADLGALRTIDRAAEPAFEAVEPFLVPATPEPK